MTRCLQSTTALMNGAISNVWGSATASNRCVIRSMACLQGVEEAGFGFCTLSVNRQGECPSTVAVSSNISFWAQLGMSFSLDQIYIYFFGGVNIIQDISALAFNGFERYSFFPESSSECKIMLVLQGNIHNHTLRCIHCLVVYISWKWFKPTSLGAVAVMYPHSCGFS